MYQQAEAPLSVFRLVAQGFRLFGSSFSRVWYWQFLFLLPSGVLSLAAGFFRPGDSLIIAAIFSGVFMVMALWMVFGYCFVFNHIHDIALAGEVSAKRSARLAIQKMLPMILAFILAFVMVGIIVIGLLSLSLFDSIAVWIYILSAMVGIFLIILLQLYPPSLLFDDLSIVKSIKQSIQLVWGNWWRTFGVLAITVILFIVVMLLLSLLNGALEILAQVRPISLTFMVINLTVGLFFNMAFSVTLMSVVWVLFYDLKQRRQIRLSAQSQKPKPLSEFKSDDKTL